MSRLGTPMNIIEDAIGNMKTTPDDLGVDILNVTEMYPDLLLEEGQVEAQHVIVKMNEQSSIEVIETNPTDDDVSDLFYVLVHEANGQGYRQTVTYSEAVNKVMEWARA